MVEVGKLWTVGYGNRQPDELIKLLKDNAIELVVDVRRKGSKAWLRRYWHGYKHIGMLFSDAGLGYVTTGLGNYFDKLADYKRWLNSEEGDRCVSGLMKCFQSAQLVPLPRSLTLLCAEKHYSRCHRRLVADRLAEELNVEVVHP